MMNLQFTTTRVSGFSVFSMIWNKIASQYFQYLLCSIAICNFFHDDEIFMIDKTTNFSVQLWQFFSFSIAYALCPKMYYCTIIDRVCIFLRKIFLFDTQIDILMWYTTYYIISNFMYCLCFVQIRLTIFFSCNVQ